MTEALTIKEDFNLVIKLGCNSIAAEGDSLETNACSGEDTWWMELAVIYADCVDAITIDGNVKFSYCREAKKTAHEIARVCFINKVSCDWDDDPLSFLLNNLINNATVVDI
jgi:hypothetical protein